MQHILKCFSLALVAMPLAFNVPAKALTLENEPVQPIPEKVQVNKKKAALGEKLYHDTLLSVDGTISCASCHDLEKGGVDGKPTSPGVGGAIGPINSPTVFNSHANFVQFWDGRAADLKEQAMGPVENPLEMGESWDGVVKKVAKKQEYKEQFDIIYGGEITKENIADAIAEFEKTLITPNSPFDKYLKGDEDAISEAAKRGYELFKDKGCTACHSGAYLGGDSYQMLSEQYFIDRGGEITDADKGRYNVTRDEADMHMFKVPMLRNIALTAPYFHDGSVKTLDEAVRKMALYQLGDEATDKEVSDIVAFLETLTGEYKGVSLMKKPAAE